MDGAEEIYCAIGGTVIDYQDFVGWVMLQRRFYGWEIPLQQVASVPRRDYHGGCVGSKSGSRGTRADQGVRPTDAPQQIRQRQGACGDCHHQRRENQQGKGSQETGEKRHLNGFADPVPARTCVRASPSATLSSG